MWPKEGEDMRVTVDLSADEIEDLHLLAKESHRTVAGEIAWAVIAHLRANGDGAPGAVEPPPRDNGDEHPF